MEMSEVLWRRGDSLCQIPPGTWIVAREDTTVDVRGARISRSPNMGALDRFTHASWRACVAGIDEEALAGPTACACVRNLNRLRTSSHCRLFLPVSLPPSRIIAYRRGWRQPSACRLFGSRRQRWAFRSGSANMAFDNDDLGEHHEDRRDVAGAGAAPVAKSGLVGQQRRSVRAFLGEGRRAVRYPARLQAVATFIVDPDAGTRRELTRATASETGPRAVMFYRPLPSRALTARDLLKSAAATVRAPISCGSCWRPCASAFSHCHAAGYKPC